MNEHDLTEIAYKNGYDAGIKEFANKFIEAADVKTKSLGCCHYSKKYEISVKVFDLLLKEAKKALNEVNYNE